MPIPRFNTDRPVEQIDEWARPRTFGVQAARAVEQWDHYPGGDTIGEVQYNVHMFRGSVEEITENLHAMHLHGWNVAQYDILENQNAVNCLLTRNV